MRRVLLLLAPLVLGIAVAGGSVVDAQAQPVMHCGAVAVGDHVARDITTTALCAQARYDVAQILEHDEGAVFNCTTHDLGSHHFAVTCRYRSRIGHDVTLTFQRQPYQRPAASSDNGPAPSPATTETIRTGACSNLYAHGGLAGDFHVQDADCDVAHHVAAAYMGRGADVPHWRCNSYPNEGSSSIIDEDVRCLNSETGGFVGFAYDIVD